MSTVSEQPSIRRAKARPAHGHSRWHHESPPAKRSRMLSGRRIFLGLLMGLCALLLIYAISSVMAGLDRPEHPLIYHTVQRSSLPITVTERGNLESQFNVEIQCEVDDIHGDGIDGTPILWIIPNGTSVKEGDLLVELESAKHKERLDQQVLETERSRAEQIQAKAQYENQRTQNITNIAEAELQVELARLELEMFKDEDSGTHKLEVEEINRQIDDVNNEILAAKANLELKKNELRGIESLFKLGYAGKSELDRSRLEFLQAESQQAAKLNRLQTQLAALEKKQTFEWQMQLMQLEGKLETARRTREQVELDNEAALEGAHAAMEAADRAYAKEQERLARYEQQLEKCKIHAPQDGMAAYAVSSSRWRQVTIAEGVPIRERQTILSLPNLKRMQVKTAVHESVLDQIHSGLPATIRVDAFPDRTYAGTVQSVAVLPDQGGWLSSDTKVYETIVTIDEEVQHLKPGMTAVVEIHANRLEDVLVIPVQAIVQVDGKSWCYVKENRGPERRELKLGSTNDKFVEIRQGLRQGDHVALNPTAITDHIKAKQPAASSESHRPQPSMESENNI